MNKSIDLIFKNIISGKIEKEIGIELLTLLKNENLVSHKDVAIIGMAAKLPGVDNIDDFWEKLKIGVDFIGDFPENRKKDADAYIRRMNRVEKFKYSKGAYLKDIDKFDYSFFGISPNEAKLMSPNQRLLLENTIEAVEDAGYGGARLSGTKTGVYLGFNADEFYDYKSLILEYDSSLISTAFPGNFSPLVANRISYVLNLKGPSMLVDTACSSSLVAIHLACQSINNGECDMAIAGSVRVHLLHLENQLETGMESSDGKAKTFDDSSDGTGTGEGVVSFLLKPLENAIKDRDNIYAVIKGTAVNQDGTSIGITAPNALAQAEAIAAAWKNAEIDPENLGYIEAHGTGTKLGDPIEISAIQKSFDRYTTKKQFCAIGSIKSNIGHLDHAAGSVGLLKAILSLKYGLIPPNINFNKPNREIDFCRSSLYINDSLTVWEGNDAPRVCGISSFGIGGTNAHLILGEAPGYSQECVKLENLNHILTLSAKSKESLKNLIDRYHKFLSKNKELAIGDICYTADTGRGHYDYRLAILIKDRDELDFIVDKLREIEFSELNIANVFYGKHKKVSIRKDILNNEEKTAEEIRELNQTAGAIIHEIKLNPLNSSEKLKQICQIYINGADIVWENLFSEAHRKRSLPVYAFERKRCWIDLEEVEENMSTLVETELFYTTEWNEFDPKVENKEMSGHILVFKDRKGFGDKIVDILRKQGKSVIEVELGKEWNEVHNKRFIIQNKEEDYKKLFSRISNWKIEKIIHLMSVGLENNMKEIDELEETQDFGVYSMFYITKAILNCRIEGNIEIIVVSDYVNRVTGKEERINYFNSTLFGFAKVVGMEYLHLKCQCFDIDSSVQPKDIVEVLSLQKRCFQIACRENKKYQEVLKKVDLREVPEHQIRIKEDGIYVITGGLGGIGIEIAKYLSASNRKVKLAFINRSEFPKREEWNHFVQKSTNPKMSYRLREIMELENLGAEVNILCSDVTNFTEMDNLLSGLRKKYGKINGIIHGAGIGGAGFIIGKDQKVFRSVMDPKVKGSWIIHELTKMDDMDFLILFSSATSIFGGPGESDYTAANSFLDAFAEYRNKLGKRTLGINWTAWKETGMAKDFGVNMDSYFKGLSTAQGIYGFDWVISHNLSRVLIGEINYKNKIIANSIQGDTRFVVSLSQKIIDKINKWNKQLLVKAQADNTDFILNGRSNGQYTPTETVVAQMWGKILGFSKMNVYDNFFELGGDSLIALRVINKINEKLKIKADVTELLMHTTIDVFSLYLDNTYLNKGINKNQAVVKEKEDELYPASSAQMRMYILSKINSGIGYNISPILTIEGLLDRSYLEDVFKQLIERHETLRTSFEIKEGKIVQKVHKTVDFCIDYRDLEGENSEDDAIVKFIQPFDLGKAPLIRAQLVRVSDNKHILIVDMHHIISDGASINILMRDFAALFMKKSLPQLTFQYKDFSVWHNNLLTSETMKKQEEYWLNRLKGHAPSSEMPVDFIKPRTNNMKGSIIEYILDPDLSLGLKQMSAKRDTTLFVTMLTAFNVLLWMYMQQEDIIVGTTVHGRHYDNVEDLIGVFINTLAMRNFPKGSKTFDQLIQEVKLNTINDFMNQDYQFDKLVEKLNVKRDLGRNPLCNVMFTMLNPDIPEVEIGNLRITPYKYERKSADVDLHMSAFEYKGKITIAFIYSTSLFKKATVERMAEQFISIIAQVIDNSDVELSKISFLSDNCNSLPEENIKNKEGDSNACNEYQAKQSSTKFVAEFDI